MTDQKILVELVLAGDKRAFKKLVEEYQRLVSHIVFRMVSVPADREDLCQEVFLKVYQNLDRFRHDSKLSTWIGRIAHNSSLNFLEKKKLPLYDDIIPEGSNLEAAANDNTRPDISFAEKEISGLLKKEIEELPPMYKTIVTLYHLDQMSYSEIASVMTIPEGTVKSYLFRSRRLLRERLESKFQREEL